jgi:hypothetical protein
MYSSVIAFIVFTLHEMKQVLFSAGWGTKEAENVFSHCWGPDEIKVLQGGAGWLSIFLLSLNVAWQYFFTRDLFKFIEAI